MNNMLMLALYIVVVFLTMALNELLWALYIHNLRDNKEHHAGMFMAAVVVLNGFSIILFMKDHWMLIPAGIGAWFGTWISKYFYKNNK